MFQGFCDRHDCDFVNLNNKVKTFSPSFQPEILRFSRSQTSYTPQAGFEPARNLSSDFAELRFAVTKSTSPRHHKIIMALKIDSSIKKRLKLKVREF